MSTMSRSLADAANAHTTRARGLALHEPRLQQLEQLVVELTESVAVLAGAVKALQAAQAQREGDPNA
ncbi:MAG: hypothetical protein IT469_11785 [Pseudomonadales bacterium]|nr:hypothetical protein [Pseudomonadales bacterium]